MKRMPAAALTPVEANIQDCLGSGYCNLGCAFGKKLSMVERVLPVTQRETDELRERERGFRGQLEIHPACEVTAIRTRDGRATGVQALLRLPNGERRKVEIEAETVVLAAAVEPGTQPGCVSSYAVGGSLYRGRAM